MLAATITINDQATPTLRRYAQQLGRPRPIVEAASQGVVVALQRHFLARNREGNKHGWKGKNFWVKEGREKTAVAEISDASATVAVASPAIAHKFTGGTVRPKRGKYLAIPLTAQAYAAGSPREGGMSGLVFAGGYRGGTAFLARKEGQFGGLTRHYLLVRSVTHVADPRTLPPTADLQAAAVKAAGSALRVLLAQATGGSPTS